MKNLDLIKTCITEESQALNKLIDMIDEDYSKAIDLIMDVKGKVVVCGVGKSGHIGKKIAASLSSTGTPSFFVHACEGVHGDLGMIEEKDIVILISNSGETKEVLNVLPSLEIIGCKKISITAIKESTLGRETDVCLAYGKVKEADHMNLAPTTSAMLTLAIGDAVAVSLSKKKKFSKENFHVFHPGGNLGKILSKA